VYSSLTFRPRARLGEAKTVRVPWRPAISYRLALRCQRIDWRSFATICSGW
jgi:hypothetical protein